MFWKSPVPWHFGSGPGITGKLMLKGKTLKLHSDADKALHV